MEKLLQLLKEKFPEIDFENEKNLVDGKVLNSVVLVQMITEIEECFDIEIPMEYISPEYFNSVEAMFEMIEELQ